MTHTSQETNAIRQRMEEVRGELDEDVQGIIQSARDMRDWQSYVRSYPWVCAGAALAIGYWIVPRRRVAVQPNSKTIAELVKQSHLAETTAVTPLGKARAVLLSCVGNLLMQRVSAYVGQQAGKHLAPQAANSPQVGQR